MLLELIDAYYNVKEDRSPEELHVSDLAACKRAVHARRSGEPLIPFDTPTRVKFDLGNAVEDLAAKWFIAAMAFERGVVVDLDGIEGHVDFVGPDSVIEVKSTTFFPTMDPRTKKRIRIAPTEAQHHYRIQAAAYALALGKPRFCVLIVCRDSGLIAEIWHRAVDYAEEITQLVREYTRETHPSQPAPPAEPPEHIAKWACKYCRVSSCERNANEAAMMVPA